MLQPGTYSAVFFPPFDPQAVKKRAADAYPPPVTTRITPANVGDAFAQLEGEQWAHFMCALRGNIDDLLQDQKRWQRSGSSSCVPMSCPKF